MGSRGKGRGGAGFVGSRWRSVCRPPASTRSCSKVTSRRYVPSTTTMARLRRGSDRHHGAPPPRGAVHRAAARRPTTSAHLVSPFYRLVWDDGDFSTRRRHYSGARADPAPLPEDADGYLRFLDYCVGCREGPPSASPSRASPTWCVWCRSWRLRADRSACRTVSRSSATSTSPGACSTPCRRQIPSTPARLHADPPPRTAYVRAAGPAHWFARWRCCCRSWAAVRLVARRHPRRLQRRRGSPGHDPPRHRTLRPSGVKRRPHHTMANCCATSCRRRGRRVARSLTGRCRSRPLLAPTGHTMTTSRITPCCWPAPRDCSTGVPHLRLPTTSASAPRADRHGSIVSSPAATASTSSRISAMRSRLAHGRARVRRQDLRGARASAAGPAPRGDPALAHTETFRDANAITGRRSAAPEADPSGCAHNRDAHIPHLYLVGAGRTRARRAGRRELRQGHGARHPEDFAT